MRTSDWFLSACGCSPVGAESSVCDVATGFCECKMNYVDRNCDRCMDGYGNVELGCVPCHCNMTGSISKRCDPVSGQCPCKGGIFGLKCDKCLEGYYSYSDNGCKWCGCDIDGSYSIQCDDPTGLCPCKPFVTGKTCDECEPGYWNLLSGKGCENCKCNITGSNNSECDELYGQCTCHPGVGGDKCDRCLPGFFGFSETGCKKCSPCKNTGHICSPIDGNCVCPPNTEGEYCERCTTSSWGYDPFHGCKLCSCDLQGSPSIDVCDVDNGNCLCLEGYEGRRCDKCRFAHYKFPDCHKCDCRHDGTESAQCTAEGQCQCDEGGQCPCKVNVEGLKCDQCKPHTFGMTVENPKGCFDCFCFERSNACKQAQMVWSQITMPNREVQFELGNTPISNLHNFLLIPGQNGNVKLGIPYVFNHPLYWLLPKEFLGEKTRSYNGMLQFHIESRSSRQFSNSVIIKHPLVILQGNRKIILIHSPYLPTPKGMYSVRLHEDEWRQLENPQAPVTRRMLMVALQNVQYILVRATVGPDVKIARLSDVSLEVAVPVSPTPASPYVAVGIELCLCPKEYSGTSCQDPGRGFYRKYKPDFLESKNIIDLVGYPSPCPCNNRSETCDPETGHCFSCRANTAGAFCELCAKGFFGDPASSPCRPCACPLVNNSFSDTCEGAVKDHACTNCQEGYEGKHCERCSRGYYGNPFNYGRCKPCECNPYGSLDRICDRMTGQCHCRPGIAGRDCTQCQARHVLTEVGCKSCEDECIGPLLDDVDFLLDMASKSNLSHFIPPPWIPLLALDNQTFQLQHAISKYYNTLEAGKNISKNFLIHLDFESLADFMYLRARDMNIKAGPLSFDAFETKEDAEFLYKVLDRSWLCIYDAVHTLQSQGQNLTFTTDLVEAKIGTAEKILFMLKQRNLNDLRQDVERELRKAVTSFEDVTKAIVDRNVFSDKQMKLSHLSYILSEIIRLIERSVRRILGESNKKVLEGRKTDQQIVDNMLLSEEIKNTTNITLFKSVEFLVHAKAYIENASALLEKILPLQSVLYNVTEQLEHHRGILARLNPRYIQKFVIPAKEHAEYISKQSLYLANLFSGTRIASQFPLKAAKIFEEVIDTLDAAEQVTKTAKESAGRAHYTIYHNKDSSLTRRAQQMKYLSSDLKDDAEDAALDVQAFWELLQKEKELLNKIVDNITEGMLAIKNFGETINVLPRNIGDKLHDIEEQHKDTKAKMAMVHGNINQLVHLMNELLYPKLEKLRVGSTAGLSNITRTIESSKATINNVIQKGDSAEKRVEKVKQMNFQMQSKLKDLKNKILLARQKTSTIRVSLSVDNTGMCVRSYRPEIEPTTTTNIVLNYAISTNEKDSLLFFLASSVTDDFMIIEMVNRKIRFLWNVGGGTQLIQHNLTIQTNDDQYLKNQRWYKIEVERIGNVATLSVKSTPDGKKNDPYKVTGSSPPDFKRMDLNSSSFFYIGGTPKGYRVPRELKARNFAGCLYEVILDGKKIGLWNFVTSIGCDGCKEGATEEADFGAYSFRGDGYAILPQIKRYKKSSYIVSFRFKTFDEDSLLFFAPNRQNGDFVSLELRDGHVVYQFNLGSQSRSVLRTVRKYNTGNWVHLAAAREKLQGQLSVDDEFLEGQLPLGSPTTMELQQSLLYYGGVSPNFTTSMWNGISFQKFFGCMKDVQIDTTPLDLLRNDSFGVDASCRDAPIKVVSFRGTGYLEMGSRPLLLESSFSFSFQTLQNTAMLLLSTFDTGKDADKNKKDYYSVAIIDGSVEARFSGGAGEAKLSTSVPVNDGIYHTVTVIKKHRQLLMYLDDVKVASGRLPKGSKDINAPTDRGLFLGGLREGIFFQPMISTQLGLVGSIKDVVFNDRLLQFNKPINFKGASIGHYMIDWFGMPEPYKGVTQPLERCSEMASYILEKNAVKFGDELYSYAKIPIGRKDFVHDFVVTFDIRTYYPNGMILIVKNGRSLSHFAVMLIGSRVVINIFDRKARRVVSHGSLNDGSWHNILISKRGRHLRLRIDKGKQRYPLKVRRRLALRSPMYVGGVPEEMEAVDKVVFESFKGCIRNFHLNDKYIDLASGELHSVGQCFSTIEPGAYFNGDAFAIYEKNFNLGLQLDIQLEFKTTRQNGVLLSLSEETSGVPSLSLELLNGSVAITVDLGDNEKPFSAVKSFQSKFEMCDGRWHIVIAQYAHKAVTLKVDMFDVAYGLSESIPLEPKTSTPLYLGGIPESAPKGALSGRDNFVGCIRNVAINDRRVEWIDMASRYNVLPNACPTF